VEENITAPKFYMFMVLQKPLTYHTAEKSWLSDCMQKDSEIHRIPKSKHVAGNFGVIVIEIGTTHSSPDAVVVDFQTSCSWNAGVTKSC